MAAPSKGAPVGIADAADDSPAPTAPGTVPERRLRILHVFRAPVGGLFRHVQDLAAAQAEAGHAVGVICDVGGGLRAEQALLQLQPRLTLGVTRLPIRRSPGPADLLVLARIAWIAHRLKPDVLHGHGAKGGLAARFARAAGLGGDYVTAYTPHGGSLNITPGKPGHSLFRRVERFLTRGTDALTFESQFAADRFLSLIGPGDAAVRVIRNGAHLHEFEPVTVDPDATDLLYLGEFRSVKGLDTLIDALALLRDRNGRKVSLTLIGAGPDEAKLRAQIAGQGLGTVRIEAPRPARDALRRGRILVLPSRAESLPYVLIEATAAGVPVIATNVGGVAEIMAPFAFGLIQPGDPAALADMILTKLDEPQALRQFVTASLQKHVRDNLSVERMVSEVEDAYRNALARRGLP